MAVQTLSSLDRTVFQPLGRIIQEAFSDGLIGTGTMRIAKSITADPGDGLSNGQFQYITNVNYAMVNSVVCCAEFRLNFAAGSAIALPGYVNPVVRARIDEVGSDQPDLSGADVAAFAAEYYLDEAGGAPRDASVIDVMAGSYKWHYLLRIGNAGDCGESAHSGGAGKVVGFDGDANIRKIPLKIAGAGVDYYFLVGEQMAEVNSD